MTTFEPAMCLAAHESVLERAWKYLLLLLSPHIPRAQLKQEQEPVLSFHFKSRTLSQFVMPFKTVLISFRFCTDDDLHGLYI